MLSLIIVVVLIVAAIAIPARNHYNDL